MTKPVLLCLICCWGALSCLAQPAPWAERLAQAIEHTEYARYQQAERLWNEASDALFGNDPPAQGEALLELQLECLQGQGFLMQQCGRYSEAAKFFEQASTIAKGLAGDTWAKAHFLENHATFLFEKNNAVYEATLQYYAALAMKYRLTHRQESLETLRTRTLLAILLHKSYIVPMAGHWSNLLAADNQRLYEQGGWENNLYYGQNLRVQGLYHCFFLKKEFGPAQYYFRKTLGFYRQRVGQKHPLTAYSHHNLGNLYSIWGGTEKKDALRQFALLHHDSAIAIRTQVFGASYPYIGLGHALKALDFLQLRQPDHVWKALMQGYRVFYGPAADSLALYAPPPQLPQELSYPRYLNYLLSHHRMLLHHIPVTDTAGWWQRWTSLASLTESIDSVLVANNPHQPTYERLIHGGVPSTPWSDIKLWSLAPGMPADAVADAWSRLDRFCRNWHAVEQHRPAHPEQLAQLALLQDRSESFMKQGDMGNFQALCQTQEEAWKLLQNIPIKPAPRYAATSLKNLQAQMDPEVVFLYPIGPSAPVTALLLTSDTIAFSTFDRYDFADTLFSKQLDSLILWASDRKNPASFDRFLEVGFELYTRMLAPIRPLWEGKRIVVISPHQRIGPLQLLPTRPCRRQDGEIPYLLREATVSYHHSAQAYLENARVPFQEPVRMLAAAPFGRHEMVKKRGLFRNLAREARDFRKASSESCKLTPDPLPYSGEEVAKIGPLWRGSRVVYERDASESEIRRLAQSCNVLHLATHSDAFYEPEGPLQHWVYFHPDAMHDGSLSFREFRSLPLQHVELAVFSSCQSGNCYNNTGSGIADFGSMAQFAGVQSAVASWWDVSDEATSYLMEKFHRHLANGMRKDDALRQAQLDYLEDSLNDRTLSLWGGFYLQGNPRPLRPEAPASFEGAPATAASRIGWLSLSIVLLLLAGMGFYQYRKK